MTVVKNSNTQVAEPDAAGRLAAFGQLVAELVQQEDVVSLGALCQQLLADESQSVFFNMNFCSS
jgi:hypothetical protein